MTEKKSKKKSPYSHLFRLVHWGLMISLFIMAYTGWAIHTISRPDWSLFNKFPSWFFGGRLMLWHILFGMIFAPCLIIATVMFFKRKQDKSIKKLRWLANYLLIYGGMGVTVSALALLYSGIPDALYHTLRFIHSICGMLILPSALVLHAVLGLTKYFKLLVQAFAPWRQSSWGKAFLYIPLGLIISFLLVTKIINKNTSCNILTSAKIEKFNGSIDQLKTLDWDKNKTFKFKLENGVGFNRGRTTVEMKSFHDDSSIYFMVKWADAVDNSHYWPWEKTENGWERLVTYLKDENVYYEDKIAFIFPIGENHSLKLYGCAITCHNKPGKPYGFKGSKKKIDVWHWKACRTAPVGYVDDKYFYGHDLNLKDVGRIADPKEKGGYKYNLSEDKTLPSHLPGSPGAIFRGALLKSKSIPFTKELGDKYKVGDQIPGTVIELVTGDRGDILCDSFYKDGYWYLYMRRKLNTGSEHDVQFVPGGSYPFSSVAFDHTGKRHAYNHSNYILYLDK